MSVPSSRGSPSESRDNVHISHEYLPLGSSPSPQPKSTSGMASWVNFPDGSSRSTRKMQSPPSHLPLSSPPRLHSRSSSESPISSMSSPSHVALHVDQRQQGTPQSGAHQTPVRRTAWVSFDEPETSSSAASPIRLVTNERDVNTPSPLQIERDAADKRVNLQQLQQSIAAQQQQQIQNREYQLQQQPQPVVLPMPYQQQPVASLRGVQPEAVPTSPTLLSLAQDSSTTFQPSTSTPAPGNPFREEMLRQQQRATSPFNPFQSNGLQTPSTPGGTVGALWGESPITPGTVTAMWERFEETAAAAQMTHGSPGNPFVSNESTSVYTPQHQVAPGQVAGATAAEVPTPHPHLIKDTAPTIPLKELAQLFPAQNASSDQLSMSTSSTTPNQSTPTTTQPFQRYTKASKQVTIRASGKRPKVNQTQQEDIVIDNTPFIDEFPREKTWELVGGVGSQTNN